MPSAGTTTTKAPPTFVSDSVGAMSPSVKSADSPPSLLSLALNPSSRAILAARDADLLLLLPRLLLSAKQPASSDANTPPDVILNALHARMRESRQLKLRFLLLRRHPLFASLKLPLTYTSRAYGADCEMRTAAASSSRLQLPHESHSLCSMENPTVLPRPSNLLVDMVDLQSEDFFAQTSFTPPVSSRWARRALASTDSDVPIPDSSSTIPRASPAPSTNTASGSRASPLSSNKLSYSSHPEAAAPTSSAASESTSLSSGSFPLSSSTNSLTKTTAARLMRALRLEDSESEGKNTDDDDTVVAPRLMSHPFVTSSSGQGSSEGLAHAGLLRPIPPSPADARKLLPPCPVETAIAAEPSATVTLLRLPSEGGPLGSGIPLRPRVFVSTHDGLPHAAAAIALRLLSAAWTKTWTSDNGDPFAAPYARVADVVPVAATRTLMAGPLNEDHSVASSATPLHEAAIASNAAAPDWAARGAELDSFARSVAGALVAGYVFGMRPAAGLVLDGRVALWARVSGMGDAATRPGVPPGLEKLFKSLGVWDTFADSCLRAFRSARENAVTVAQIIDPLLARDAGLPNSMAELITGRSPVAEFVAGKQGVDVAQKNSKKAEANFRRWLGG